MDNPQLRGIVAVSAPADWPFEDLSPIRNAARMKYPVLLLYGAADPELPALEGEALLHALLAAGKRAELRRYAGSGRNPADRNPQFFRDFEHFERRLRPAGRLAESANGF